MGNVPNLRFPEFSGEWENCQIANILSIGSGRDYKHLEKGNIPVFGTGGYMTSVNECIYDGETTFIGRKGSINKPFYYNGKFWTVDTLFYTHSFNKTTPKFVYCLFQTINWLRYNEASGVPSLSKDTIEKIKVFIPQLDEQRKISEMLSVIDERIATQNKIIEDLKKLKSAIIHRCYSSQTNMIPLSELLKQCSDRNRSGSDLQVLSVSNKYGFIAQSDQFEDREVASDDTSNYKVVKKGMFAYNPARINVGSIALYEMDSNGIVSPMYVCFTTKSELLPSYLKYYFASQTFKHEMYKRLEGSVRLCLTFEELCNIEIHLPSIEQQKNISKYISKIENNLSLVDSIFSKYQQQRRYLLSQMFI